MEQNELIERAERAHYVFHDLIEKETNEATFAFSYTLRDYFWNYAGLINTGNSEKMIGKIEKFYSSRDRNPAAYITSATAPDDLGKKLKQKNFEKKSTDAWMFFRSEEPETQGREDVDLKKVEKADNVKKFLEIFRKAYGGSDEEEAYGNLPEYYVKGHRELLKRESDECEIKPLIAVKDGEPAAIGILIHDENTAGIYSLGTSPEFRGEGVGTFVLNSLISMAIEVNMDHIFLQTEKGSRNEQFFSKRGFETVFTGDIMVKEGE